MTKLPEVKTIKNILKPIYKNYCMVKNQIHISQFIYLILQSLSHLITKNKVLNLQRKAEYLIFKLTNGYLLLCSGIAGIRNIYASKILFCSGVILDQTMNTKFLDECKKMYKYSKFVSSKVTKVGMSAIRDFKNLKNGLGYFI